jgi:hypothetical protein
MLVIEILLDGFVLGLAVDGRLRYPNAWAVDA